MFKKSSTQNIALRLDGRMARYAVKNSVLEQRWMSRCSQTVQSFISLCIVHGRQRAANTFNDSWVPDVQLANLAKTTGGKHGGRK